jgi:Cysteine-rich CWC
MAGNGPWAPATLAEDNHLTGAERETTCPTCGARFGCGAGADDGRCWCQDLPPLTPVAGRDCLCPACLMAAVADAAATAKPADPLS